MATELPTYQSQLPQLLSSLLGTGKTTTTKQSSPANISGLEQIFAQALGKSNSSLADSQGLIEAIFREGSAKIPELTQAFANATGTRTTGNSGLALALGDLNKNMSAQALQTILSAQQENQRVAANAATGIAQATQGTSSTQTQQTGANATGLITPILGTVLNKLDKKGVLDFFKSGEGASEAAGSALSPLVDYSSTSFSPVDTAVGTPFGDIGSSQLDGGSFDFGTDMFTGGLGDAAGNILSDGLDFGPDPMSLDFGGGDILDGFDLGSGDGWGTGDLFDNMDLGSFFKDGGRVMAKPRGYADGGTIRNKNYMGAPRQAATTMRAASGTVQAPQAATTGALRERKQFVDPESASTEPGVIGDPATNNAVALGFLSAVAQGMLGVPGLAMGLNAVTGGKSLSSIAKSEIMNALGLGQGPGVAGFEGAMSTNQGFGPQSTTAEMSRGFDVNDVLGATTSGFGGGSGGGTGAGGSGASGSGVGADGSAASGVDGDSGVGGTGSYKDGGLVRGPGTGTSDSIPVTSKQPGGKTIKYSDNEYVMSDDVVRLFGTLALDRMMNAHMPATR